MEQYTFNKVVLSVSPGSYGQRCQGPLVIEHYYGQVKGEAGTFGIKAFKVHRTDSEPVSAWSAEQLFPNASAHQLDPGVFAITDRAFGGVIGLVIDRGVRA